jgi:hypothetical protein
MSAMLADATTASRVTPGSSEGRGGGSGGFS